MNEQEAIMKAIDYLRQYLKYLTRRGSGKDYSQPIIYFQTAISALLKRKKHHPHIDTKYFGDYKREIYKCPCCEKPFITYSNGMYCDGDKDTFCKDCGQAIEWEGV